MEILGSCLGLYRQRPKSRRISEIEPLIEKASLHPHEEPRVFRVLVTGLGAFPKNPGHPEDGRYLETDNTSHLITTRLPSHLPAFSAYNPTPFAIEILNPTSAPGAALKTEYHAARTYIQHLWTHYGNEVDLVLHLGMADGWEWYALERSAWKEGTTKKVDTGRGESEEMEYYVLPDDAGKTIKDLGPCPWNDSVPQQLFASDGLDVDELARSTQMALGRQRHGQEIEVRAHPDSGNYLCGFVAYESLARAFVNGYTAKTLFCHIPGWRDERGLEKGKRFVCTLISQIAARVAAGKANGLDL